MTEALPVAVVIPCHDAAAWLEETIASVRAQAVPVAEVVVVDDGSTDGSAELAERLGVRCVRQAQAGPGAARNHGVRATAAPWVAFLDADDRFLPSKLQRQLAVLEASGAPACCTDAWLLRDGERGGRKNAGRDVPERLDFARLLEGNPVICSTVVACREALERAGGFDEDRELIATEDYDLWLRMARQAPLHYLDEPLLEYRASAGSLSDDERFVHGIDRIMAKVLAAAPSDADLQRRIARRRAGVRTDAAWQLVRRGERRRARRWLREARDLGGWSAARVKIWLRTLLAAH